MPYVFGYGSLLNPGSAAKTLGRTLAAGDLLCTTLPGYRRSWTASSFIRSANHGVVRPCQALFLDLSSCQDPQCSCNGVALQVTEQELAALDIREMGYRRCTVELQLENGHVQPGYAYVMPDCCKQKQGVIPARYKRLIEEALHNYSNDFVLRFWQTTLPSNAEVVEGEYVFENRAQNKAAGRSLGRDYEPLDKNLPVYPAIALHEPQH
ncbi:MAG: gamma-glutamylcyclotransferase family protein [Thiolinea sp.]